jgi:hypothetical protein
MYLAPKYKYTLLLLYYKTSVMQIKVNINILIIDTCYDIN